MKRHSIVTERRAEKIKYVLEHRQPDLTVVLENIHDPHNVSAILRSADAVGVKEVFLVYNTEEFPKLGKKSSASALKWVDKQKFSSISECYDYLRNEGFKIYATHLTDESVSLYDLNLTEKVAFVFGNEHTGVSSEAATLADLNFKIPMYGMIQSLNVSVACAVSLYEALRQRLKKGDYNKSKIKQKELKLLFDNWTKR
ncbi:MAG: tRNA (guanosine(18)-2'-O)-methyltransferase [Ignavibacteriae bacterium]|nr:MAG: tRNA (guanosine(18)-2'-O)-methyltransferase [Ignavibacteriota bacterium]